MFLQIFKNQCRLSIFQIEIFNQNLIERFNTAVSTSTYTTLKDIKIGIYLSSTYMYIVIAQQNKKKKMHSHHPIYLSTSQLVCIILSFYHLMILL